MPTSKPRTLAHRLGASALLLVLLGSGLLLRARLPRPQTPTDAWLWSRAEAATEVVVAMDAETATKLGLKDGEVLRITERQGIRRALRAFGGTSQFGEYGEASTPARHAPGLILYVLRGSLVDRDELGLAVEPNGFYLCSGPRTRVATTDARSVARLYGALRVAVGKARHHERGYRVS